MENTIVGFSLFFFQQPFFINFQDLSRKAFLLVFLLLKGPFFDV